MRQKSLYFTLLCSAFLFRDLLGRFLPLGEYYFIAIVLIDLVFMAVRNKLRIGNVYLLIINVYVGLLLLKDLIMSNFFVSVVGALNLLLFLNYFSLNFRLQRHFKSQEKAVQLVLVIIAFGAMINFFISPTIFGLIDETVYSNQENLSKLNFTKRAVSFIKSPQSLGFVLSLFFLTYKGVKIWGKVFSVFIFIAGVITFSKSFFITVLIALILKYRRKLIYIIAFALTGISLIDIKIFSPGIQRILDLSRIVGDFSSSDRFLSYSYFLAWESLPAFMFGNGVGKLSRGAELFSNSNEIFHSSESFIIQLYYEIGVVGLVLFILLMVDILRNIGVKYVFYIVLLLSAFTPSLYGYAPSFFFYYFLFLSYSNEPIRV